MRNLPKIFLKSFENVALGFSLGSALHGVFVCANEY